MNAGENEKLRAESTVFLVVPARMGSDSCAQHRASDEISHLRQLPPLVVSCADLP